MSNSLSSTTFTRVLDLTVSLATVAAAAAILWVVLVGRGASSGWLGQGRAGRPPVGYVRGEKIDALSGIDFRAARRTLLVVFTSHCQFCIQSVPYYRRLASMRDKQGAKVRVIAVGFEQDQGARSFPGEQAWQPDQLVIVPPSKLKVRGAPAILLVDANGTVVESWLGETSAETYEDILKTTFQ
jgi:hypothetical protein